MKFIPLPFCALWNGQTFKEYGSRVLLKKIKLRYPIGWTSIVKHNTLDLHPHSDETCTSLTHSRKIIRVGIIGFIISKIGLLVLLGILFL